MLKLLVLPVASLLFALPAVAAPSSPSPDAGQAQTSPAPRPDRTTRGVSGIMRYDANKDGIVDRAEWQAGQEARYRSLDTNKDGKLSQEELFARTPAIGNAALPADRQTQRQSSYFQRMLGSAMHCSKAGRELGASALHISYLLPHPAPLGVESHAANNAAQIANIIMSLATV